MDAGFSSRASVWVALMSAHFAAAALAFIKSAMRAVDHKGNVIYPNKMKASITLFSPLIFLFFVVHHHFFVDFEPLFRVVRQTKHVMDIALKALVVALSRENFK